MNENMHNDDIQEMNDSYTSGSGDAAMKYDEPDFSYVQSDLYVQDKGETKHTSPKKKHHFKNYLIAFVLIAAALLLIFGATFIMFNPKRTLYSAFRRTYNEKNMTEGAPGEALKAFEVSGGELTGTVTFKGGALGNPDVTPGVRLDLVRNSDKMSGDVAITKDSEDAAVLKVFSEDGKSYVTVENVLDGYLAADNNGFVDIYNKSALAGTFGEIKPDKVRVIEILLQGSKTITSDGASNAILKLFDGVWRDAKVKKSGTTEVTVAGEPETCRVYKVTLQKSDAIKLMSGIAEYVGDQDADKAKDRKRQSDQKDLKPGEDDPDNVFSFNIFDEFGKEIQEKFGVQTDEQPGIETLLQIFENAEDVVTGPVTFDIYADSKYIRGFSVDMDILGSSSESATLSIESHNTGIKNPISSMDMNVDLADGSQSVSCDFKASYNNDSKVLDMKVVSEAGKKNTTAELRFDTGASVQVAERDANLKVVDIGSATDEEVNSFLTQNAAEFMEFISKISDVVGLPEGAGKLFDDKDGSKSISDYFSEFFDYFKDNKFSEFFGDDSFSDFFDDDYFSDLFEDYPKDGKSGNDSEEKNDRPSKDSDPLGDDEDSEDF
ncbi:MAG: hypothetical protein IKS48_05410 [Eubacterium sp.]|nr:hypothetical protein [Eubacterium sp.]